MGLVNLFMKGLGFEGDEELDAQAQNIAEEKRKYKELKKKQKLAKKLERQKAKNMKYQMAEEPSSSPAETIFDEPEPTSTFDPDQYNISSAGQNQQSSSYGASSYDSGYGQTTMNNYGNKNIIFFYPKQYSEVQKLIEYLKNGESVMLNLTGLPDEETQRILDFTSGAIYALSGNIQRVSGNIFLLTPEGLSIINNKK